LKWAEKEGEEEEGREGGKNEEVDFNKIRKNGAGYVKKI